jgi:hypothetical protein
MRNMHNLETVVRGGRLTKWKGKVASYAPGVGLAVVLSIGAGSGGVVFADVISEDQSTPYFLDFDEDLEILSDVSVTVDDGSTAAIVSEGDFDGTVLVDGTVDISDDNDSDIDLTGVYIEGDLNGAITNNGTINVNSDADGYSGVDAKATGIYVDFDVTETGSIENTDTILVQAEADGSYGSASNVYAEAYGIEAGDVFGEVKNSGTVTVLSTARSGYGIDAKIPLGFPSSPESMSVPVVMSNFSSSNNLYATALGLFIGEVHGTVENSGQVIARATVQDDYYGSGQVRVSAAGIDTGDIEGTFSSTGSVEATATVENDTDNANVDVLGISVGDVDGAVSLSGTVDATATVGYNSDYAEIDVVGVAMRDVNGTVDSAATITVEAISQEYAEILAGGIVFNDLDGSLVNTGDIGVTAEADGNSVMAAGIFGREGSIGTEGSLTNQGDLTVSAQTKYSVAAAAGIAIEGVVYGALSNEGDLIVDADGQSAVAVGLAAYGVGPAGSIENSGTIEATAEQFYSTGGSLLSAGMAVGDLDNFGRPQKLEKIEVMGLDSGPMRPLYVGFQGVLENSGSIYAETRITHEDADGAALGMVVLGSAGSYDYEAEAPGTATLRNTGSIEATVTKDNIGDYYGSTPIVAAGILVEGVLGGQGSTATVDNQGSIEVTANNRDNDGAAQAAGISVNQLGGYYGLGEPDVMSMFVLEGPIYLEELDEGEGIIVNSGSIDVKSYAGYQATAGASGIQIEGHAEKGSIDNTGSITVMADGGDAEASGIYVDDDLAVDLINAGELDVSAYAYYDGYYGYGQATARGMVAHDIESGARMENAGTLTVHAYGHNATAIGLDSTYVYGTMTNSATLEVSAITQDGSAIAKGLNAYQVYSDLTMSNTEDLTVEATATDLGYASARGLEADDVFGTLSNSGTVTVTATADEGSANAKGIDVDDDLDGTLSNTGTVRVTASSVSGDAGAKGVDIDRLDGSFENAGLIMVSAHSDSGSSYADGIEISTVEEDGIVTNSGTIMVGPGDNIRGIDIGTLDGQLIQTGDIMVPTDETAIYVGGGYGTATISTHSEITGRMTFHNSEVVLVSESGESSHWMVDGSANIVLEENGGSPWFNNPDDEDEYATFSTINTAGVGVATADIARLAFSANLLATRSGPGSDLTKSTMGGGWQNNSGGGWIMGHVSDVTYGGVNSGPDQDTRSSGVTLGYTGQMQNGLNFTVLGGIGRGSLNGGSSGNSYSDADFDATYVGGVISRDMAGTNISFGVIAGIQSNDTRRGFVGINGPTVAKASFDSSFVAAELGVSHRLEGMGNGWSVTPGLRLRYTSVSIDGYTETGSSANAQVGSHTVGITDVEASVAVAKQFDFGTFTSTLGLMSRHAGNSSVSVELIGDTNSVSIPYADGTFGTFGVDLQVPVSDTGSFNFGVDAVFGSGTAKTGYTANAGFSVKF